MVYIPVVAVIAPLARRSGEMNFAPTNMMQSIIDGPMMVAGEMNFAPTNMCIPPLMGR
jgi:hypothetical protein